MDRSRPAISAKQDAKRATQWREDNAEALRSSNTYVEVWGLPLSRHGQFESRSGTQTQDPLATGAK
ncbi:type II toxin-antitoxin system CcdA family antitoxin [Sphingobium herbicidovorans]|uniref:type II toxin-antitoxin system CcdA family antitoxin n=1 Tax=Sphingobium herbicidovorans TaxID=76947 RepID=UPI0012E05061